MKKKTKICSNPICNEPFEYKNPKKRFCGQYCKNQAAYNYTKSKYTWELKMQKERYINLKLLEYHVGKKTSTVTDEELKKAGFNFDASYLPIDDPEKGAHIFRFENIGIVRISAQEYKLINF